MKDSVFRELLKPITADLIKKCISIYNTDYEWAKKNATSRNQGLKLHVEYDLGLECPTQIQLSYPNLNDSSMDKRWPIDEGVVYVLDKGYCDYDWWWSINEKNAYFVSRLKVNAAIKIQQIIEVPEDSSILEDGLFLFSNPKPRGGKKNLYTSLVRRISVAREDNEPLILVTNLLDEPAEMIAELYKSRWQRVQSLQLQNGLVQHRYKSIHFSS